MSGESFRYKISHRTVYQYTGRIDLCHSLAHLTPREDEGQVTESRSLVIEPEPDFEAEHTDYLGNAIHYFSIHRSHKTLEVLSEIVVKKAAAEEELPLAGVAWDEFEAEHEKRDASGALLGHFLIPSTACPMLNRVRDYLRPSLVPGRDVMEVVQDLMSRVYKEFTYTPGATTTTTPLGEVMDNRKGVCQDFAHVMIAALRSAGIPTRYVSGYLETLPPPGKKKLRGADASHAWIEAWGPKCGWVGFDPTNDKRPGARHIKVCHGRDYFDVQPVRGLFLGSGSQSLRVEVDVERISEEG